MELNHDILIEKTIDQVNYFKSKNIKSLLSYVDRMGDKLLRALEHANPDNFTIDNNVILHHEHGDKMFDLNRYQLAVKMANEDYTLSMGQFVHDTSIAPSPKDNAIHLKEYVRIMLLVSDNKPEKLDYLESYYYLTDFIHKCEIDEISKHIAC